MEGKILTKQGLRKVKEELEYLKSEKIPELAKKIADAKELGDLSENAEYQDAKDEQGLVAKKIMELEEVLRNVIIHDEDNINTSEVEIGNRVIVETENNTIEFKLVSTNEVNPAKGMISNESPLGQQIMGKKKGDEVEIDVPKGKIKYKIIDIK